RNEHVRAWAVRLTMETPMPDDDPRYGTFIHLAKREGSPLVRLHLLGGLGRTGETLRMQIIKYLALRPENGADPYLPLMLWYAILGDRAGNWTPQALPLISIPLLRENMTRRCIEACPDEDKLDAELGLIFTFM